MEHGVEVAKAVKTARTLVQLGITSGAPILVAPPSDAKYPNGAKAPGKPGQAEGFKDSKGGESWVPNPNPSKGGGKNGWLDDKGNVWVPTGQGGNAHGGPHWDVQKPGGGYENVRPVKP